VSDRIAAIVLLVFALYYGFEAWRLESGFGSGVVEPKDFPLLLAGGLLLFAIGILFRADPDPEWFNMPQWLDVVVLTASFAVYAYLLVPIGFLAATTLETSLVSWRFGAKPWQAVVAGLCSSAALYALFVFGLGIPLPRGRMF
jgi:putative tricarboxylic transport membrane protein